MLRVVAICAVALGCHLIVVDGSEINNDTFWKNGSPVEEFTSVQPEIELTIDNEDENRKGKKESDFCTSPPAVDGVISPVLHNEEHPVGTIISYQCKFGYVSRSSGSLLSVCRVDELSGKAEWTYPNSTCIPRSCGDPGYVANGRRIGNLFTFPNKVIFECLEGYKMHGLKDRYCQANGEWSGNLPTCVLVRCAVPSNPKNGRVIYSSLDYGTELQYVCDKGFMLNNHELRICSGNGFWSSSDPECIETSCKVPDPPVHGSVQLSDEPKVGALAFYFCNEDTTLIGASTSKCLSSGDWTFDPPKCLSSCHVSDIKNGELGKFERKNQYSFRKTFSPMQIGQVLKHNEKVILLCKDGYIPTNSTGDRWKEVSCEDGKWSEPLECNQMLCTGEPPNMDNGTPQIGRRQHGSTIWYKCDPGYEKTKSGRVVCNYEKWEGPTPVCTDYRCQLQDLQHLGLRKPRRKFLNHGEYFDISCENGYKKTTWTKKVTCFQAKWDISRNPCTIKTCEDEPPQLNNGRPREFSRENGSIVNYQCDEDYEMIGHSSVQCVFGTWKGLPPDCKRAMQFLKTPELKELETNDSVIESTASETTPSHFVQEECFCTYDYKNNYFLKIYWKNKEVESDDRIPRGEKVVIFCQHNLDIIWPNGLRIFEEMELACDPCHNWQPNDLPQCDPRVTGDSFVVYDSQLKLLPDGVIEVPKSERVSLTCINPWLQPRWNITQTGKINFYEGFIFVKGMRFFSENITIDEMDYRHNGKYECFAMHNLQKQRAVTVHLKIFGNDVSCLELLTETEQGNFVIQYSNNRKVGSIARYTCIDPLKKIIGPSERKCLDNGKWSDFPPSCEDIRCPLLTDDDMVWINYNNDRRVNSVAFYYCRNTRQRMIGSSNRTCLHSGKWSGTKPTCEDITCPEFPQYNGLMVTYSRSTKFGSTASFSCLNHATLVGSPYAVCQFNGTWNQPKPSCEMLEVLCPKLEGKGIFSIKYTNGRRVNSTAQFFCKARNQKVEGCNFMICQQNGEWSGDYPTCVDFVTCDLFGNSANLRIIYTDGDRVGSIATFHCLHQTTRIGRSSSTCLSNGTWSHPLPICKAPNCSIADLEHDRSLPDTVHLDLINVTDEFVLPGSEIPLICEENLILTGPSKVICNLRGKWEIGATQCIPACRVEKIPASHLIIEPEKDYYRFGEFILLSCPPGQKLSGEVERMMCLGKTWSDTLPDCIEVIETDPLGFTETTNIAV